MIRSVKDMIGYPVMARDGKAGKVKDLLFGDRHWRMRYLDVETRTGLRFALKNRLMGDETTDRRTRFLLEPKALETPTMGIDRRVFPTKLDSEQIEQGPSFEEELPMEEKFESEFRSFFHRSLYEEKAFATPFGAPGFIPELSAYEHSDRELQAHLKRMDEISEEHLHSARAIFGYHAESKDEVIGSVSDLILDLDTWTMAYVVVSVMHVFPPKKYLVKMEKVGSFDWSSSTLKLNLNKQEVEAGQRYWPYDPVNRDEDGKEYDYCGRPRVTIMMEELY